MFRKLAIDFTTVYNELTVLEISRHTAEKGIGMPKRIDAHLHIATSAMLGVKDPFFGTVMRSGGEIVLENGFVVHTMPLYFTDANFSAEAVLAMMDECGVEKAVIQQGQFFDRTKAVCEAVRRYPGRFRGAMMPDLRDDDCADSLEGFMARGLTSVKFEMNALGMLLPSFHFGTPLFDRLCAACAALGLPITVDPGPIGCPTYQVEELGAAAARHPKLTMVICHLGFPRPEPDSDPAVRRRWRQMLDLGQRENVYFDLAAMPDFFDAEGWPFPTALRLAREFTDLCGPDKLMWGSDVPGTLDHATYAQQIRMVEESNLFTAEEKRKIFYDTAEKVYFRPL